MDTNSRLLHMEQAWLPMDCTPLGRVSAVSFLQSSKARSYADNTAVVCVIEKHNQGPRTVWYLLIIRTYVTTQLEASFNKTKEICKPHCNYLVE